MHAGFFTLRNEMSMDLLGRLTSPPIERRARSRHQPDRRDLEGHTRALRQGRTFLFGAFSNADAMYAPVATRFRTYGVDVARYGDDGTAASYIEAILALPAMAEWTEGAKAEMRAGA